MSFKLMNEISFIRKVGKIAKMYYISIPFGLGKELYKKKVIVKIIPIVEEDRNPPKLGG